MIQLQSTANVGLDGGIKCLIYGASGVGKTPLCATAPAPIIISAEKGLLSLRKMNPPIPFIEIRNYGQLYEAYQWAAQSVEGRQFHTLCLDSLSEIAEVVLTEEKRKTKDPRKAYGAVIDSVIELAKGFRDLPRWNTVCIAKEEYSKDEIAGTMMFEPMMPGRQLGQKLPYYFDETFRMIIGRDTITGKEWRALHTRGSFQHVARDRSGNLDEYEQPNLTNIFRKILAI